MKMANSIQEQEWVDMNEEIVFEQQLLTVEECFVYRLPPRRTAGAHRAEDWGLDHPALTGSLRVVERGDACFLEVYEKKVGFEAPTLFCSCPIRLSEGKPIYVYFDQVADSSRYFVIRAEDPKTKRAINLGMGVRDRQHAFDLKAVINDFERRYNRTQEIEERQLAADEEEGSSDTNDPSKQLQDLSLKEGEKIKVNITGGGRRRRQQKARNSGASIGGGLLPPPPASAGGSGIGGGLSAGLLPPPPPLPPPTGETGGALLRPTPSPTGAVAEGSSVAGVGTNVEEQTSPQETGKVGQGLESVVAPPQVAVRTDEVAPGSAQQQQQEHPAAAVIDNNRNDVEQQEDDADWGDFVSS